MFIFKKTRFTLLNKQIQSKYQTIISPQFILCQFLFCFAFCPLIFHSHPSPSCFHCHLCIATANATGSGTVPYLQTNNQTNKITFFSSLLN
jgi:hypothetical protein